MIRWVDCVIDSRGLQRPVLQELWRNCSKVELSPGKRACVDWSGQLPVSRQSGLNLETAAQACGSDKSAQSGLSDLFKPSVLGRSAACTESAFPPKWAQDLE
jgi:hypothetical protein